MTAIPDVEAPLEEREPGGLGLFLIYQTMDYIDYEASAAGNCLTFTKNFPKRP
jgi:anti-sigma regulatory factor (Ser/Thr protein kinase)